ncbi:MAG: DUF554 domain-containing protein [Collinsella sp.]|nr:DUF554 domain-containing protein [Collinsella sp.]
MIGIGTVIDVSLILIGGVVGLLFRNVITARMQDTLLKSAAVGILFVGISGALSGMFTVKGDAVESGGTMLIIVSLALGSLIGEVLDIDRQVGRFGEWLKYATGSGGDSRFVNAFVTTSITVAVGAMAIVGAIQDGIAGDWSVLAIKGTIDALLVCTMTTSMGKGCIFSVIPVIVLQGSVTVLARLLQPLMTALAIANLSTVGSILIFCAGVNIIWKDTFRVANMLPAMVVAVAAAFV